MPTSIAQAAGITSLPPVGSLPCCLPIRNSLFEIRNSWKCQGVTLVKIVLSERTHPWRGVCQAAGARERGEEIFAHSLSPLASVASVHRSRRQGVGCFLRRIRLSLKAEGSLRS